MMRDGGMLARLLHGTPVFELGPTWLDQVCHGWCVEEIGDEWHVRILVVVVSADSLPSSCQVLNARNTGWIRGSNCSPLQKLSKIHALTRVGSAR